MIALFLISLMSCLIIASGLIVIQVQKDRERRQLLKRRIEGVGIAPTRREVFGGQTIEEQNVVTVNYEERMKIASRFADFIRYDPLLPLKILRTWRVAYIVTAIIAFMAAFVAQFLFEMQFLYLIAPFVWVFLLKVYVKWCEGLQKRILFAQFPDAIDVLVRSMRIGVPMAQAMEYVAENAAEPTASRFRSISGRLSIGATIGEALDSVVKNSPIQEYRFFAVALRLQAQTGGNIVGTLENLASTIRTRSASQSKAKALLAEPKMSMAILASLPFILTTLLGVINPSYMRPLFVTRGGHHTLLLALGLWSFGIISMQTLIKRGMP